MNDKVKAALARVASRLQGLSKEAFHEKLQTHSKGEIASALMENFVCASLICMPSKQLYMKISQSTFIEQEIQCYAPQIKIAANDENYLMAA